MLRFTVILALSFLATFARADSPLPFGPFQGVDMGVLSQSQRETITKASEDFERVLKGSRPKHATLDEKAAVPADGGTAFFLGKGYKLTVIKSLSSFGGLQGFVYGPVVSFEKSFAPGNMSEVVNLRFYTTDQLQKLMSSKLPCVL
jgi:hypothetical protein